jgi:hypothetical protein
LGYSTAARNSAPRAQWSFANTPVLSPVGSPQSQRASTDGINLKGSKHRVTDQGPDATENAGPAVLLFGSGEPGSDWVLNNAVFYAFELRLATDEVIMRFSLPEWTSGQAQKLIGFSS